MFDENGSVRKHNIRLVVRSFRMLSVVGQHQNSFRLFETESQKPRPRVRLLAVDTVRLASLAALDTA